MIIVLTSEWSHRTHDHHDKRTVSAQEHRLHFRAAFPFFLSVADRITMSPTVLINNGHDAVDAKFSSRKVGSTASAVLHRSLHHDPARVVKAQRHTLTLSCGRDIVDATGGAAVACIGHGDVR